jgi:glycosyltransferase involved in cell wall biosynthesis
MNSDRLALAEARAVYTISQNTADRLKRFNGIDATPLYHPPADFDRLGCESYGDFIFFPSRIERIKRQHLLVEAAARLRAPTRVLLAGAGNARDLASVRELIAQHELGDRVILLGHVSEEEKRRLYANCLAVYFGAYDEDYGYVTLEGLYARKPVIIHPDAGGPTEFVVDGETGVVVPPDPGALAHAIDELAAAPARARALGERGFASLADKRIDWDEVIGRLLSHADA